MAEEGIHYDFEERTNRFALEIRLLVGGRKWTRTQWSDIDQLLRSSGSIAANYIEANNAISKADFLHRLRISKKEASESRLWLRLLGETTTDSDTKQTLRTLYRECDELTRILAAILRKSSVP